MVTHPEASHERLRIQLEEGTRNEAEPDRRMTHMPSERHLTDEDRELLLAFDDRMALLPSEYGIDRREKHLRACTIMAEPEGHSLAEALENRNMAEELVRWIHDQHDPEDSPETNKDYRTALRMFGKRVAETTAVDVATDDGGYPETLTWIPTTTSRNYDPSPDPSEMLKWESDVKPMIESCLNARDKALMAVAWDAGPRSGELLDLRVGDVSDHRHGLQITVDGKTGQRSIMLVSADSYLSRWLSDHPRSDDDTAPLWCKLRSGEEISYQMARKIPREAADRADVTKPVTFTNFRKSSASHLASSGVNQAVLEDHHGWTRGSKAAARYIAVFGEASDREIARAHGLDIEADDEPESTASVTCDRCGQKSPPDESFCMWCHKALEPGAVDELEREQDAKRRELLGLAKDNPELLERLEGMEPFVEAFGGDPSVIETARRFAEAADEE